MWRPAGRHIRMESRHDAFGNNYSAVAADLRREHVVLPLPGNLQVVTRIAFSPEAKPFQQTHAAFVARQVARHQAMQTQFAERPCQPRLQCLVHKSPACWPALMP